METNARKARVLIVDDDPALCRLLKFGLDRAGYETLTAADGAQAMALLGPQRVDLIIVDLMMPVIDGLRFLRWLRQEAKLDVPALAFTSSGPEGNQPPPSRGEWRIHSRSPIARPSSVASLRAHARSRAAPASGGTCSAWARTLSRSSSSLIWGLVEVTMVRSAER